MNEETSEIIFEKGKAGFPALFLLTSEDQRTQREVKEAAALLKRPLYVWTLGRGLRADKVGPKGEDEPVNGTAAPLGVLEYLLKAGREMRSLYEKTAARGGEVKPPEGGVYLLRMFHHFLDMPPVQALILDLVQVMKMTRMTMIITSPMQKIPMELEKELSVIETRLPSKEMLTSVLDGLVKATGMEAPSDVLKKILIESATGLTTSEAENVFSLSIVRPKRLKKPIWDATVVLDEKVSALKKSGLLEYIPTADTNMSSIGGMKALKGWVSLRKSAFSDEAKAFGLPPPKGILMVGPPGSGKSLGAKAVSSELNMPLIRADFGKLLGSLVGQSEANMRKALDAAEAMSPCILWIDEIEKALAGSSGGSHDSGVGARLLGHLLTWMQEKTTPVFVYATANDVTGLPPELLRKGRFDEMWSVLLPNDEERKEILQIHLAKKGRAHLISANTKKNAMGIDLDHLVEATVGFSGAEIEAVITEALFQAFNEKHELNGLDLASAVKRVVPLSRTMSKKILELEQWCKTRTRAANGDENTNIQAIIEATGGRLVDA